MTLEGRKKRTSFSTLHFEVARGLGYCSLTLVNVHDDQHENKQLAVFISIQLIGDLVVNVFANLLTIR